MKFRLQQMTKEVWADGRVMGYAMMVKGMLGMMVGGGGIGWNAWAMVRLIIVVSAIDAITANTRERLD